MDKMNEHIEKAKAAVKVDGSTLPKRKWQPQTTPLDMLKDPALLKVDLDAYHETHSHEQSEPKSVRTGTHTRIPSHTSTHDPTLNVELKSGAVTAKQGAVTFNVKFFDQTMMKDISMAALRVLLFMAHYASQHSNSKHGPLVCDASAMTITSQTGLSVTAFYAAVRSLQEHGFIKRLGISDRVCLYQINT